MMSDEKDFTCKFCKKTRPKDDYVQAYDCCIFCEDKVFDAMMIAKEMRIES